MQTFIWLYIAALAVFWAYHDLGTTFMMIVFSAVLAVLPFTRSWIFFGATILAILKMTFFPSNDYYDFDFVLMSLCMAPVHYVFLADNIIGLIQSFFND